MKTTGVFVIALAILIAFTGVVMADQGVPAVPETQGITTTTVIDCEGIVMDSSSLGWTIDGYTTTYDAGTIAQNGHTTFVKTMVIGTGNTLATQSNVKADTAVTFVATGNGGNILGSENIMIDGRSNATTASDRMRCPFGGNTNNVIPAYCNIVQAGSKYDLTIGSVVTSASDRFIGTDASIPVVLNYAINVKPYTIQGQGTFPAMGSASAYVKAHIQEGRGTNNTSRAEDLTYSESSSASGIINAFTKIINYQSGKALLP